MRFLAARRHAAMLKQKPLLGMAGPLSTRQRHTNQNTRLAEYSEYVIASTPTAPLE
jgi:hypothetical protein